MICPKENQYEEAELWLSWALVHATKCWGNSWISLKMKAFGRGPRLWTFELNLEKLQKILPVNDVLVTFLIALTKYLTKACFGKLLLRKGLLWQFEVQSLFWGAVHHGREVMAVEVWTSVWSHGSHRKTDEFWGSDHFLLF